MNGKVFLFGFIVVAGLVATFRMIAWSIRRRPQTEPSLCEPRSLVRVLHTDDELREAVERSLRGEHPTHEALRRRLDRYARACKETQDRGTVMLSNATESAADAVAGGRRSA